MTTEAQKEWNRILREEKKKLEGILHPCPKIGNMEILHEHLRNGNIRFTAWVGCGPVNNMKQLVIKRQDILTRPEFYQLYQKDIEWLARKED